MKIVSDHGTGFRNGVSECTCTCICTYILHVGLSLPVFKGIMKKGYRVGTPMKGPL